MVGTGYGSMTKPITCPRCKGRKHVLRGKLWEPCWCVQQAKTQAAKIQSGLQGEARPLAEFGGDFGKFVRRAMGYGGPSMLYGQFPLLMEAARSALHAAIVTDRTAKLFRLPDLVDVSFDRDKKAKVMYSAFDADFTILVCGDEPTHSYNGPTIATICNRRRLDPARPTLIATSGDLVGLYGERTEDVLRGLQGYPQHKLMPQEDRLD